jgi:chromosomal replication initiation ATPase DnaA
MKFRRIPPPSVCVPVFHSGQIIDLRPEDDRIAQVLHSSQREPNAPVTIREVEAALRSVLRLPTGALQSVSSSLIEARKLGVFLARKHTSRSERDIQSWFRAPSPTVAESEAHVREWIEGHAHVEIVNRIWSANELIERIERELETLKQSSAEPAPTS